MAAAEWDDWVSPTSRDVARAARSASRGDRDGSGWAGGPTCSDAARCALGSRLAPAVSFATTEHFTLQTARGITVAEANGRASIYLAALSANLVALALVGQVSRLGPAFHAFALILLPVLGFVGV